MLDGEALGKELTGIVKGFVERATAPLLARIDELEKRQPERGADGAPGVNGRDGEPGEKGEPGANGKDGQNGAPGRGIAKLLIDAKGHMVVTFTDGATDDVGLIIGKDGQDGKDGRDGVDGASGEKGADGAPGRDGENGKDGLPGADGKDGADGRNGTDGQDGKSVEPEVVAQMVHDEIVKAMPGIENMVAKAVDAMPRPRDGIDGKDGAPGAKGDPGERGEPGKDGTDGRDGQKGADGKDGADGVGLADAVIDRDGNLVLTMTNGRHKSLGVVLGKDGEDGAAGLPGRDGVDGIAGADGKAGADGRDGRDGLGFDDLSVDYDGEREIKLLFQRADETKEFKLSLPIVLDRGVWVERGIEGAGYKQGDGVSWGGSFYIARKDTFAKPDDFEAWRLSVKRGKDAKEPVNIK